MCALRAAGEQEGIRQLFANARSLIDFLQIPDSPDALKKRLHQRNSSCLPAARRARKSGYIIELGYNLIVAADGKEALKKALAFGGKIDLLLSDVEMPGMTGIELAIQAKPGKTRHKNSTDFRSRFRNAGFKQRMAVLTQALRIRYAPRSD